MKLGLRFWVLPLLVSLVFGSAFGQTTLTVNIDGILPVGGTYCPGQSVKIYGDEIFDFLVNSCDDLRFRYVPTNTTQTFLPDRPGFTGDYSGFSSGTTTPKDTIYWTFPITWAPGAYEVRAFDDEGCTPPNLLSAAFAFNLGQAFLYGDSIFCVGEPNPMPDNVMPAGVFEDITVGVTPLTNIVLNSTTGELGIHSGTVGVHIIRYTANSGGCIVNTTVEVKAMQTPTITYDSASYCKVTPLIPAPILTGTGLTGTYAPSPSLNGFNPNGSITVGPTTAPGNYTVTFTPDANSCGYPCSDQFQIINLDSAIFNYQTNYCHGSGPGYPVSITSLPSVGGSFVGSPLTPGLFINPSTGIIDLDSTVADTYYVEFVPNSLGCFKVFRDTIYVLNPAPSSFTLDTLVCANSGILSPVLTTPIAGSFFAPGGGISIANATTGDIDTDLSTPGGPYRVYRTNGDLVCPDSTEAYITIQSRATAVFNYGSTAFCQNAPNPFPVFVSGTTGGFFQISPGTGTVRAATGELILDSCAVGTYSISYITGGSSCPDTAVLAGLKVDQAPNAFFDFPQDSLCQNTGPYAMPNTPSGGTDVWSLRLSNGTPLGGMSGAILFSNLVPPGGPYEIVRTSTLLACTDSFVDYLTMMIEEDATFAYDPDSFCSADQNPVPQLVSGGGVFSNVGANNLVFVAGQDSLGRIDLALSDAGTHIIQYRTTGFCPDTATTTIFIRDALNPVFSYDTGLDYCESDTGTIEATYQDSLFGPGTFIFTSSPPTSGLISSTGSLILDSLTPGVYGITMSLVNPSGACTSSYFQEVTISQVNARLNDTMFFSAPAYCLTDSSTRANLNGPGYGEGRFFSRPPTLGWVNRDSGIVRIAGSSPGTYAVFFIYDNACSDTLADTIVLTPPVNPTIRYIGGPNNDSTATLFCKSDTANPRAYLIPSTVVGLFSFTAVRLGDSIVFVSNTTGEIDLARSDPGSYRIKFRESSGCAGNGDLPVSINSGPSILLQREPGDTICQGDPVVFRVEGSSTYQIFQNGNLRSVNQPYATDSLRDTDIITTSARGILGCSAFRSVQVKVYPVPDGIVLNPPGTISGSDSIHILMTSTQPQTYFTWTASSAGSVQLGSLADSTLIFDPPANVTIDVGSSLASDFEPGIATFYITPKAYICTGEVDTVVVKINPSLSDIFIPEVFTPDGNGQNDAWLIQLKDGVHPEDYEIYVFNRSGGQVHYMSPLNDTWNADGLPDGVYWYLLKTKTGTVLDKGAVTVRRK